MKTVPRLEHIIRLGSTPQADWGELLAVLLVHVQQAAHESGAWWLRPLCQRRVRLELLADAAIFPTTASHCQYIAHAVGKRLESEYGVRHFSIIRGADPHQHRLVLTGF